MFQCKQNCYWLCFHSRKCHCTELIAGNKDASHEKLFVENNKQSCGIKVAIQNSIIVKNMTGNKNKKPKVDCEFNILNHHLSASSPIKIHIKVHMFKILINIAGIFCYNRLTKKCRRMKVSRLRVQNSSLK